MRLISAFILAAVLAGCATKQYSPSEYREAVRNYKGILSSMVVTDTVDLPRSYPQLSDTVRKKSKECLDVTVESSAMVKHGAYWVREGGRTTYTPIVTADKGKTEITVQASGQGMTANPVYALDLQPAGKNGTRVTYYRSTVGISKNIHAAVEGWMKGKSTTCPNWNG